MHKSYQPILPTHNKLLQKRWDEAYYNEHKKRLATVVPVVNTSPPKTFMHLHLKLKKLQLEEERLAVVERDNRMLLEKMACVMRTRGRLDNQNYSAAEYKSLNREKRERELLRVAKENQSVLRRILQKKADYDNVQLQKSWQQNLKYMDNLASYPNRWWTMSRSETRASKRRSGVPTKPLLPPIKSGSFSEGDFDNREMRFEQPDYDVASPPFESDAIPSINRVYDGRVQELSLEKVVSARPEENDQEIDSTARIAVSPRSEQTTSSRLGIGAQSKSSKQYLGHADAEAAKEISDNSARSDKSTGQMGNIINSSGNNQRGNNLKDAKIPSPVVLTPIADEGSETPKEVEVIAPNNPKDNLQVFSAREDDLSPKSLTPTSVSRSEVDVSKKLESPRLSSSVEATTASKEGNDVPPNAGNVTGTSLSRAKTDVDILSTSPHGESNSQPADEEKTE